MDRVQLVLLGLPILLFCSDVVTLFAPLPPAAPEPDKAPHAFQPGDASAADASAHVEPQVDGPGSGTTVDLKFCASCSYRGTAMTMKRVLETSFPGIHVVLENYPPPFPKRALSKAVPLLQFGAMATLMAGDQIFPRFGMVPPPWYYSLRANRFGTMASIWLFGNFAHSFLQSSGAFEVYCNGQLVFSKLSEQRFPSELELQELIGSRIPDSQILENLEKDLVLDDADSDDAMRDVHRKMERKQLPLVLTRLVSHPGAQGEIGRHVRCNALMQCVDSLKLRCVYIEQVWMAGQGASPYVRYGTKVTVKKRVSIVYSSNNTSFTPYEFDSGTCCLYTRFCWSPPVWCW